MKLVVRNLIFRRPLIFVIGLFVFFLISASALLPARAKVEPAAATSTRFHMANDARNRQGNTPAAAKQPAVKEACVTCHINAKDPHPDGQVPSCVACHGGNATATSK